MLDQPGPILLGLATIQRNGGFRSDSLRTYGGESPDKLLVQPGELYVSLKDVTQSADLLGAIARLPLDYAVGRLTQDTVKLEPISNNVPIDYLYWLLRTPQYRSYCRGHATGTTNLGLAREDFIAFPAPEPTAAQRSIAHVLGTLDDKIELNRRMNETLEAMVRAIFKSWFVDFDPVRAKAEGRDPGPPEHIADLFPNHFEHSELGEIPAGWKNSTLGEIAENPRRTIKPAQMEESTTYIGLEHMPRQSISLADWDSSEGLESNKYDFKRGEILFGKLRPYFHKVGIAPVDGICSTDILVVAAKQPEWHGFLLEHLSSEAFVNYTSATSSGTKMPRTNWKDMSSFSVTTPQSSLAQAFDVMVKPLLERIVENIHEARTIAPLRDTLLPRLISGELRVGEAEAFVEDTLQYHLRE